MEEGGKKVTNGGEQNNTSPQEDMPDFRITKKGWLTIAVVVMYVAAIWMPFIGNSFGEEFFETQGSLGYLTLLMLDSMEKSFQFASLLEMLAAIALFVIPIIHLAVSGFGNKLGSVSIISAIQLGCLFYLVKSWFVDNSFVKMSAGFYFYLIATLVVLFIGIKDSDDASYFGNLLKNIGSKIRKNGFFVYVDNLEKKYFPLVVNEKSMASMAMLFSIISGLFATLFTNNSQDGVSSAKYIAIIACIAVFFYSTFRVLDTKVSSPEKLKYALFMLAICIVGCLLGYFFVYFIVILIAIQAIRVIKGTHK